MRRFLPLPFLLVAACDVPAPFSEFAGAPPREVEAGGMTFSVRVAGDRAQATRISFEPRAGARGLSVIPRAGLAMERVSGCSVVAGSLVGDAALVTADLRC